MSLVRFFLIHPYFTSCQTLSVCLSLSVCLFSLATSSNRLCMSLSHCLSVSLFISKLISFSSSTKAKRANANIPACKLRCPKRLGLIRDPISTCVCLSLSLSICLSLCPCLSMPIFQHVNGGVPNVWGLLGIPSVLDWDRSTPSPLIYRLFALQQGYISLSVFPCIMRGYFSTSVAVFLRHLFPL